MLLVEEWLTMRHWAFRLDQQKQPQREPAFHISDTSDWQSRLQINLLFPWPSCKYQLALYFMSKAITHFFWISDGGLSVFHVSASFLYKLLDVLGCKWYHSLVITLRSPRYCLSDGFIPGCSSSILRSKMALFSWTATVNPVQLRPYCINSFSSSLRPPWLRRNSLTFCKSVRLVLWMVCRYAQFQSSSVRMYMLQRGLLHQQLVG